MGPLWRRYTLDPKDTYMSYEEGISWKYIRYTPDLTKWLERIKRDFSGI
jgi:hypothetical protein